MATGLMLNSPAQVQTGRRLLAKYGSWDAVRKASVLVNGVWFVGRPQ